MTIVYIILGIVALFFGMQFFMIIKMRLKKGKDAPEVTGKVGKMIGRGEKVMIYFFSPGCRACGPMTPIIDNLSRGNKNVFKIDVSKDMQTAQKFGVMGTPSTVLVEGGKIREFLVGYKPPESLHALLV